MSTPIFTDARVRAIAASQVEYGHEPFQRGAPEFTLRSHVLSEVLRNANRWVSGYQSPDSKAKGYGSLIDTIVLVPEQFNLRYAMRPDTYPAPATHIKVKSGEIKVGDALEWNANAKPCKEWAAQHKGLTPVTLEQQANATMAISVLHNTPRVDSIIASGPHQVWIEATYNDRVTGRRIRIKALMDIVPNGEHPLFSEYLFDFKTTRNASPRAFARECCKFNYDLQAALYMDLYNAAHPEFARINFAHIVQENFPPYATRVPILSQRFIDRGRFRYQQALALYARAQETGVWPGYDPAGDGWPITEPEDWMMDLSTMDPTAGELGEEEAEEETTEVTP